MKNENLDFMHSQNVEHIKISHTYILLMYVNKSFKKSVL